MNAELSPSQFRETAARIEAEVGRVIVGQRDVVRHTLVALLANGHLLLEGLPGLGKTMLVRTLASVLQLDFNRVQFTPDLMPADIIGTDILEVTQAGERHFRFHQGPVFTNLLLADEINRATPKTQSALLEAMQEHTISVARTIHRLEEPFFVMATQNPIEMEGTYPLPEAQLDRFFFKVLVAYPTRKELAEILERTTKRDIPKGEKVMDGHTIRHWQAFVRDVAVAPQVTDRAVAMVLSTQPTASEATAMVRKYARFGSSPRGAQALILAGKVNALREGRFNVSFADLKQAAKPALRHRILLNFEAEADGVTTDNLIDDILTTLGA